MSVQRVVESPRVTKPYSDDQWRAIDTFGRRIEQQLKSDDVRVTIGGEVEELRYDVKEYVKRLRDAGKEVSPFNLKKRQ